MKFMNSNDYLETVNDLVYHAAKAITEKKDKIIALLVMEKLGIDINEDIQKWAKRFVLELEHNRETLYFYNKGEKHRIVTFETTYPDPFSESYCGIELIYY